MVRRPQEITIQFFNVLDQSLADIVAGKTEIYPDIRDMAERLNIHPTHLSNTIKEVTGKSPCQICHQKTIELAKKMLSDPHSMISTVAYKLTYEPAHFTKYFKSHTGLTPRQFRNTLFFDKD